MQINRQQIDQTHVKLTVSGDTELLQASKSAAVKQLGQNLKLPGFRAGKVPAAVIEKNLDQNSLQTEFLDTALNRLYAQAIESEKLRPVAQPKVSVTKFVPFSTLEAEIEVEVIGAIELPDYKKLRIKQPAVTVTAQDVTDVLDNLRTRAATKSAVERPAKDGDEVTIDFTGVDAKTKAPIDGADGTAYPLVLGSNTFIHGFEPELVGLKPGAEKTFELTFPEDYGAAVLQNKRVSFTVKVTAVQALDKPKLDDAFAATVGPFKTLADLKADIKKQLQAEKETQAQREYESQVLEAVATKTKAAIPSALVDEEIDRQEADERQNLTYRGQTWEEHLKAEGVTPEEHREKQRPAAELRVKAGLALSEIAEQEGLTVTPEELEIRMQLLKGQYTDPAMQAELDKPAARRDIASRLLSEKTINKLTTYASTI